MQQQELLRQYTVQEVPEHPVNLFYGPTGEMEYVVKGFGSAHELYMETEALRKIKALGLAHVETVNAIDQGKITNEGTSYWFLTQTAARGFVMADFITQDKSLKFDLLRMAVRALARTTASLHAPLFSDLIYNPAIEGRTTNFFLPQYNHLEKLKNYGFQEEWEKHLKFYKQLKKQVKIHFRAPAYSHGDLQWCNAFYDPAHDDIILIDVQTFREYSGNDGTLLRDILHSQISLWYGYLKGALSKADRNVLQFDFFSIYAPRVSTAPNNDLRDLFWEASCLMIYLDYNLDLLGDEDEEFSDPFLLEKIHEIFKDFEQLEAQLSAEEGAPLASQASEF